MQRGLASSRPRFLFASEVDFRASSSRITSFRILRCRIFLHIRYLAAMRAVIQRVTSASCTVDKTVTGAIDHGFLVLLGVGESDTDEDVQWLAQKIINLRVFGDDQGLMNRSIHDIGGNILLISQFTLHALTKKGNRPSFIRAAKPDKALPLYEAV